MPKRTPSHSIVVMRDGKRVRATPNQPFDFTKEEIEELEESDPLALVSDAPHGKSLEPQGVGPVIVSNEPSRFQSEPEPIREPVVAPRRQGDLEETRRTSPQVPATAATRDVPAARGAPAPAPAAGRRDPGNL